MHLVRMGHIKTPIPAHLEQEMEIQPLITLVKIIPHTRQEIIQIQEVIKV